ncbi:hypothetical protein SAICODRAFT_30280 [Saitoella complicata NRRL Y-17804]|uniref:uncharacterized protein n=1 Tax=Saitoella complicata (strain BCRC 22490 / CBS 7301 / JCM 7358 / NBRC 10748 / NRRL Y-17804) TaxID=698492 RepID=UPI000867E6C5|nr:uncharacterized protein SAICODRAFT_30280 [Saitoella complicata NRRL Y-17804]ODQ53237.1 hypothetical protein SAICODRAFT_30280 [Saitoella complicata NRRL Y-17804]
MVRYNYLISKRADVVFAVFVGVTSYALYEGNHPRAPGHSLVELLRLRIDSWRNTSNVSEV